MKADLDARAAAGEAKYGEKLKAHNGRDALVDAYQEALDLVQYLRQELAQRGHVRFVVPQLLKPMWYESLSSELVPFQQQLHETLQRMIQKHRLVSDQLSEDQTVDILRQLFASGDIMRHVYLNQTGGDEAQTIDYIPYRKAQYESRRFEELIGLVNDVMLHRPGGYDKLRDYWRMLVKERENPE